VVGDPAKDKLDGFPWEGLAEGAAQDGLLLTQSNKALPILLGSEVFETTDPCWVVEQFLGGIVVRGKHLHNQCMRGVKLN
jgi:hypothetical protein